METKKEPNNIREIGFEGETSCQFCGQILLNGDECTCTGAKMYRRIQDQIERAVLAINEIFGEACKEAGYQPVSENSISLMNNAAMQIANYKMHAVSFTFASGTRAKLTRGAKGAIKVERLETKKASTQV